MKPFKKGIRVVVVTGHWNSVRKWRLAFPLLWLIFASDSSRMASRILKWFVEKRCVRLHVIITLLGGKFGIESALERRLYISYFVCILIVYCYFNVFFNIHFFLLTIMVINKYSSDYWISIIFLLNIWDGK